MPRANVYLTGFMGSGKSTVGPLLAAKLDAAFVDLDASIERTMGVPLTALFANHGEAAFRRAERAALRATTERYGLVVAAGGGALLDEAAYRLAASAGTIVYLRMPIPVLAERLAPEAAARPLLHDPAGHPLAGEPLADRISALLAQREAAYERADVIVQADALPAATVATWIAKALMR
ncbi:MAG: shikimate kinase [Bacteroidota bacterium]